MTTVTAERTHLPTATSLPAGQTNPHGIEG
jgi:hypothetical protein